MTVISAYFEKYIKHVFTLCLVGSYHCGHGRAIQKELDRVITKTLGGQGNQVGVLVGDVRHEVLLHGLSGGGQGWAGQEEGLHCPFVGLVGVPTGG